MTALRQAEMRRRVVAEARSWLGTPYHHHGRVKGAGVDCAQILAAVFEAVEVVPHLELGNYSTQWHLHRGEETYLQNLEAAGARRLAPGLHPQPGDVGVWRFGRTYSHGGIVVEGGADPLVVHSYVGLGVVITRASEAPLAGQPVCYWSIL
jgi:cell wall-associated NlpC family hydrolase